MLDARFAQRFNQFLEAASAQRNEHRLKNYPNLQVQDLEAMEGQRYVRVVSKDQGSRYCYCFVDKTNGDVLKSAGWKAPAKHARSNIFDADFGLSGVSAYGAKYLR